MPLKSLFAYSFQSFYLAGSFLLLFIFLPSFYNLSAEQEKLLNQFNDSLTKKNSTMTEGFFDKVKKMFN